MNKIKNILTISATVIATVIGAGFATGQEIFSYFCVHGKWGILGLIFVFFLFWFAFDTILCFCYNNRIDGFSAFLNHISVRGLACVLKICVALFSFCGMCSMGAATGAYFTQTLHLPYVYGVLTLLLMCAAVLLNDIRGLTKVNFWLAPVICAGVIWICIHSILFRDVQTYAYSHYYQQVATSIRDGFVYVSYNLLSVLVVLCSVWTYSERKKELRIACICSAGTLTLLAIFIWFALGIYRNKILLGSIPLYDIVVRSGGVYSAVYSLILLLSVFTTAIGCGYAAVDFIKTQYCMQTTSAITILMLAAIPICSFGFEDIVRVIYSFFGYLGLPFLVYLFYIRTKFSQKDVHRRKNI